MFTFHRLGGEVYMPMLPYLHHSIQISIVLCRLREYKKLRRYSLQCFQAINHLMREKKHLLPFTYIYNRPKSTWSDNISVVTNVEKWATFFRRMEVGKSTRTSFLLYFFLFSWFRWKSSRGNVLLSFSNTLSRTLHRLRNWNSSTLKLKHLSIFVQFLHGLKLRNRSAFESKLKNPSI